MPRRYDPLIGRFGKVDPLSDQSNFLNTFQFAGNNPISMNDPTGMYAQYKSQSSTETNMNPNFGGPSIDEINSITGYNSDWGADAGKLGPYSAFWSNLVSGAANYIANGGNSINLGDFLAESQTKNGIQGTLYNFNTYPEDGVYGGWGNETTLNSTNTVFWFEPAGKNSHFWGDLGGTVGGAVETVIGVFGEPETAGTSTFLVADGGDRVLSNGYNLWHDIFSQNSNYNRIPFEFRSSDRSQLLWA